MFRTLSSRPDLEQYKRQAKALLRGWRTGEAAALERHARLHPAAAEHPPGRCRLHDAQWVLAREHGFPSWRAFKARVEALNDVANAEAFLRAVVWSGAGGNADKAWEMLALRPALAGADFWCACVTGNAQAVEAALGEDATLATRKGGALEWEPLLYVCFSSILHAESRRGEGERFVCIARLLLERGADANAFFTGPDHFGNARETVLYGASGIANHPALTELLLEAGADPNDGQPESGGPETVYHTAEFADLRCMKLLFAHGVSQPARNYCLYRQLDFEHPEGTLLFLKNGANPNGKAGPLGTALHHAIRRGRSERVIRHLLEHGADARLTDGNEVTPYRLAARLGREEVCAALAEFGGKEPLSAADRFLAACAKEDAGAVARSLEEMPGLATTLTTEERGVFLVAVQQNRVETARLLLEAGFDPQGDEPKMRPLHWAAWFGHVEMVDLLLQYGPDIEAINQYGGTPLGVAVYASRHCQEADSEKKNGRTLSRAERERAYLRVVRLLLKAGATPKTDMLGNGITPVDSEIRKALKALSGRAEKQ